MNRNSPGLNIGQAISGFLQAKTAEARSPRTLVGYKHDLEKWLHYAGDIPVADVTTQNLRARVAWPTCALSTNPNG